MQNSTERTNGQPIPQNASKQSIAPILLLAKPVPVLDMGAPASDVAVQGAEGEIDARIPEHVTAPAIVVARDHCHRHSRITKIHEGAKHSHAAAWHHRLPLEPEFEEITVDQQRACTPGQRPQVRKQRALDRLGRMAEVDVGDDMAGWWQHEVILYTVPRLYKLRQPDERSRFNASFPYG